MNFDVLLRQWGDIYWVRTDEGSTTTGSFVDALFWAMGDMSPGDTLTLKWGPDIPEDQSP